MADEKIQVEISGKYDSKAADEAIKDAEAIEKADPELKIGADNTDAVAKIDEAGDRVRSLEAEDVVVKIKAQIDDLKAQTAAAETDLKNLGDTAETTGHRIDSEIGGGSEKAQGAVHSMAGEAITSLPLVGDAVGPAGEAIGQLTEGLLAGEIAMGDLVAAAGPLVALTIGFKVVSGILDHIAKIDAFNEKQVDDWRTAIQKAIPPAEHLAETLEATGKIEFQNPLTDEIENVIPVLARAGVSLDQFNAMVSGGLPAIQEFDDKMTAAGIVTADLGTIFSAAIDIHKAHAEAVDAENQVLRVMGTALDGEAHGLASVIEPQKKMTKAVKESIEPLTTATASTDALTEGYGKLQDKLSNTRAIEDFQTKMVEAQKAIKKEGELTVDQMRGVEDSIVSAGEAAKVNPILVQSIIDDLDPADVNKSFVEMQHAIDQQGALNVKLKIQPISATLKLAGRDGTGILIETDSLAAPSGSTTYNVSLPRGVRYSDISKAVGVTSRRNGKRFGVRR